VHFYKNQIPKNCKTIGSLRDMVIKAKGKAKPEGGKHGEQNTHIENLPRPLKRKRSIQVNEEESGGEDADDEADQAGKKTKKRRTKSMAKKKSNTKTKAEAKKKPKAQPKKNPIQEEGKVFVLSGNSSIQKLLF